MALCVFVFHVNGVMLSIFFYDDLYSFNIDFEI